MCHPNRLVLIALLLPTLAFPAPPDQRLQLGRVLCQTVRASRSYPQPQESAPWVVVRFVGAASKSESFALTDDKGWVVVPLRPGKYCIEAYDEKGYALDLDAKQPGCFELKAREELNVGVVLAYKEQKDRPPKPTK